MGAHEQLRFTSPNMRLSHLHHIVVKITLKEPAKKCEDLHAQGIAQRIILSSSIVHDTMFKFLSSTR